jgi:spore maturation protein CgeB
MADVNVLIVDTTIYAGRPLLSFQPPKPGLTVSTFDEAPFIRPLHTRRVHKAIYRLMGRRPPTAWDLNARLVEAAEGCRPDVVIVSKGAYVFPKTLRWLRALGAVVVNYATDDPFNERNADGWLRASIPEYDLYACTKRAIMADVRSAGCARTAFVRFAYNPDLHFPEQSASTAESDRFSSDVAFVGTADRDRWPYLDALLSIPGLRLALYGSNWHRQPERFSRLGRGMAVGRDYRLALSGAKIALGLLRSENRDGHTMRTFEIPACGGFLCAQRTAEHEEILRGGHDAVFFDDPDDLRNKVTHYLDDEDARLRISRAGLRAVSQAHTYADRIEEMVNLAQQRSDRTASPSNAPFENETTPRHAVQR